jgi:hypothetical protein
MQPMLLTLPTGLRILGPIKERLGGPQFYKMKNAGAKFLP